MSPSIDPRLAREALLQIRSRKDRFLAGIKSILERRKNNKEGEKNRGGLGLDSWDGFTWAELRQEDGQRAKREWDSTTKEWIVVPNLGLERSISPCDIRRGVTEEDDDAEVGRGWEEESIHDSFYAAPTSVGSPTETDDAMRSISEPTDDDGTIRPSLLAASQSDEIRSPDQRKDSDATIRPDVVANNDYAKCIQPSVPVIDAIAELSRPSLAATKKHISLRRTAIWNAARRKGLEFWKLRSQRSQEGGVEQNDAEEPLLASSKSKNKALPKNPSKTDLDGLSKLIESIDALKVNSVKHIWHEDTHTWTHERTASTQTEMEIQALPQNEVS